MDKTLHPVATHHLPGFVTAPGETDVLMVVTAFVLLASDDSSYMAGATVAVTGGRPLI